MMVQLRLPTLNRSADDILTDLFSRLQQAWLDEAAVSAAAADLLTMPTAARVLWTKQVRKKAKTYNDGFLLIGASGQATLFDEQGKELATACVSTKLPYGLAADPASAEDLSCFEGYLVQGDSPCQPCDISAARGGGAAGAGPMDASSTLSTKPQHGSSAGQLQGQTGVPQLSRRVPAAGAGLRRGCAGMAGPAGPAPPTAPLLGRMSSRQPATVGVGTAATEATLAAPQPGSSARGLPAPAWPAFGNQPQQQGARLVQNLGSSRSSRGSGGAASAGWGTGAAAPGHAAGSNISCAATLQSADVDILQLLDSITPAGCNTWGGSCADQGTAQQQHQDQHQQRQPQQPRQQQQPKPLPAVLQFGRQQKQQQQQPLPGLPAESQAANLQQRWLTPPQKQQQQQEPEPEQPSQQLQGQWQQQQGQQGDAHARAAAGGSAAFQSARNAWTAPRGPAANGSSNSSIQGRQALQPVQPVHHHHQQQQVLAQWNHPQPQKQTAQDVLWGQQQPHQQQEQQQPQQRSAQKQWAAPAAAAAGVPPKASQQRAGFNMPRPAQPPAAGAAGTQSGGPTRPTHSRPSSSSNNGPQGVAQGYCYPGPTAAGPQRLVQIPSSFSSSVQYVGVLTAALTEEVNLQLADQARTFYNIIRQVQGGSTGQPGSRHPAAAQGPYHHQQHQQQQQQRGAHQHQQQQQQRGPHQQQEQQQRQLQGGGRQQAGSSDLASRLQAACARSGLHYHPAATLTVYNNSSSSSSFKGGGAWGSKGKKRGRGYGSSRADQEDEGEGPEGDEEDGAPARKAVSIYLTLSGKLDRRQFRKHDLWVLSNHPLLKASAADSSSSSRATGPYDRLSQPWVVLARAIWHGPDVDGKMQVELLPGQQQLLPGQQQLLPPHHKWQRSQSLTALQGPDVATDVQMGEFIAGADVRAWALLGSLLKPWQQQQQQQVGAAEAAGVAAITASSAVSPSAAAAAAAVGVPSKHSRSRAGSLVELFPDGDAAAPDQSPTSSSDLVSAGKASAADGQQQGARKVSSSSSGGSSSSEDEEDAVLPVQRRQRKRRLRHAHCRDGSGDEGQEGGAATAAAEAAAASDSDLEDDFEPVGLPRPGRGKRIRRASAAAAAAVEDVDSLDDSGDEMQDVGSGDAAAAGGRAVEAAGGTGMPDADGCSTTAAAAAAAAQELLHSVIQRFTLNPAQAAVAAHVAVWLPQLMQDVQQRQQQGKKRGIAKPLGAAAAAVGAASRPLLAAGSAAAAAAGGGLAAVAGVVDGSSGGQAPVCLIHGPFGSGKSTLLVALIHLLTGLADQQGDAVPSSNSRNTKQQQQQRPTPRILVAAHTNVAVDRVLLGLQEAGFSNMLRVGSLARIAKRLLGVSLHSADDSRDALSQLNGLLRDAAGAEEAMIRSEIASIQAGAERRRRKALSTTAVVGITCCSVLQSTLEGQVFDVVLLDEASQMTEPTSLVPLLRAKPRFLIAAGDHMQLPPVLTSPTNVNPAPAAAAAAAGAAVGARVPQGSSAQQQQQQGGVVHGLLRPLFVRLKDLGHVPHLLTHQYRCHPMLSMLSNKHFYNSRLVDGVTEAQRSPLLPGLPPLVVCDCQGGSSQAAGGGSRSSVNRVEAKLVAQLVLQLLTATGPGAGDAAAAGEGAGPGRVADGTGTAQQQGAGAGADGHQEAEWSQDVDPGSQAAPVLAAHQLGVICFFRGQAALIKQLVAADPACRSAADVQVATVDSFQGAEKEVIILATTTTNPHSEFCSDAARLNVALTRARRHLLVVGAASVLAQTPSGVLRELVSISRSGQHSGAAYMPGGSVLQLLAQQQQQQ